MGTVATFAPKPTFSTEGLEAVSALVAAALGVHEGRDDAVTGGKCCDGRSHLTNPSDELMTGRPWRAGDEHTVSPQVRPANGGERDIHDDVSWVENLRSLNINDGDVRGAVQP
jgi:hypothetical protein